MEVDGCDKLIRVSEDGIGVVSRVSVGQYMDYYVETYFLILAC